MKTLSALLFLLLATTTLYSQNEVKPRQEIDLLLSDFNSFGTAYRIGNDASLFRIGLNFGSNTSESKSSGTINKSIDSRSFFDISLGWEKRFEVVDRLFLRLGADAFYQNSKLSEEDYEFVSVDQTTTNEVSTNGLGARLVLGTMYQLNPNIHIGFEVMPQYIRSSSNIERTFTSSNSISFTNQETSNRGFNFNTSSLRLNFGFNF